MPDGFAVRMAEKGLLRDIYEDLCEPGDHHPECPPGNQRCPHPDDPSP